MGGSQRCCTLHFLTPWLQNPKQGFHKYFVRVRRCRTLDMKEANVGNSLFTLHPYR